MSARELRRFLPAAQDAVQDEIRGHSRGTYGAGLASEGYAGGYRDCLADVLSILNDVPPGDLRGYWRRARNTHRKTGEADDAG